MKKRMLLGIGMLLILTACREPKNPEWIIDSPAKETETKEFISKEEAKATAIEVVASKEETKATTVAATTSKEEAKATVAEEATAKEEAKATAIEAVPSKEEAKATAVEETTSKEEAKATAVEETTSKEEAKATVVEEAASKEEAKATAVEEATAKDEAKATVAEAVNSKEEATSIEESKESILDTSDTDISDTNPCESGHDFEEVWWEKPDCEFPGSGHGKRCRRCEAWEKLPEEPLGHVADEGTLWKEPDCLHDGYKSHVCIRCQATLEDTVVPANPQGHRWCQDEEGWYCEICSAVR